MLAGMPSSILQVKLQEARTHLPPYFLHLSAPYQCHEDEGSRTRQSGLEAWHLPLEVVEEQDGVQRVVNDATQPLPPPFLPRTHAQQSAATQHSNKATQQHSNAAAQKHSSTAV